MICVLGMFQIYRFLSDLIFVTSFEISNSIYKYSSVYLEIILIENYYFTQRDVT